MSELALGYIGLAAFLLLMLLRVPIGLAMAFAGCGGILLLRGPTGLVMFAKEMPYSLAADWTISAIPMFLLMGTFGLFTGLIEDLFDAARLWLNRLPGGLAIATVASCVGFGAASGSAAASTAAMARLSIPYMVNRGYDKGLAAGTVVAAGPLDSMIPPSIVMVVYSGFTGVSLGKMLMAGYAPGLLLAAMYTLLIIIRCKRNPSLAPRITETITRTQRMHALAKCWPLPVIVLIVMGGIYTGVFTPTEAGAFGAFITLIITLAYRRMTWQRFRTSVVDAAGITASILLLLIGAKLLAKFLALSGMIQQLGGFLVGLNLPFLGFIGAISLLFFVIGCFMETVSAMLIVLPMLMPVLDSYGADMVWFGILFIMFMDLGVMTPPFAFMVFLVKGIVGDLIPLWTIYRGAFWFVVTDAIALAIVIFFPQIPLFLPNLMSLK